MKKILFFMFIFLGFILNASTIEKDGDGYIVSDQQESKEIKFSFKDTLIKPGSFGTGGYIPSCHGLIPMGIKINLFYGAESKSYLKGRGIARWPESVKVFFKGTPNGGHAEMNYGIKMEGLLKNCFTKKVTELSKWLNFDLQFFDEKTFDPFALDGSPDNPVSMEDSIDSFHLWDGTLDDMTGGAISISLPFIGSLTKLISFSFDLDGKMYMEIFGGKIALDDKTQRAVFSDDDYLLIDPPLVGTKMEVPVHYEALVYYDTVFRLIITIKIKILELSFPIPIEIPGYNATKRWVFNQQKVTFDFPAVFIENRMHEYQNTIPGDEDYWEFDVENIGTRKLDGVLVSSNNEFMVIPKEVTLKPGEKTTVTVFFKPYSEGKKTGAINFYSNDPVEPVTKVALFGSSSESDTQWNAVKNGEKPKYVEKQVNSGCSLVNINETQSKTNEVIILLILLGLFFIVKRRIMR